MRRKSATPDVTALTASKCASETPATNLATVVLPLPGGPHRMNDGILSASIAFRSARSGPRTCCCPTNSSKVRGRTRSAKGAFSLANSSPPCSNKVKKPTPTRPNNSPLPIGEGPGVRADPYRNCGKTLSAKSSNDF